MMVMHLHQYYYHGGGDKCEKCGVIIDETPYNHRVVSKMEHIEPNNDEIDCLDPLAKIMEVQDG